MTYKPGSVPTAEAVDDGYSSRMAVANHLKQPTRTSVQDRTCCTRQRVSLHGLAPDGVYHARSVTSSAVRSYRTFSPLPNQPMASLGGVFSVALSIGSRRPDVIWHPALRSPDFPRSRTIYSHRNADRARNRGCPANSTADVKPFPYGIQVPRAMLRICFYRLEGSIASGTDRSCARP